MLAGVSGETRFENRLAPDNPRWLDDHRGELNDYLFFPFGTRYSYIFIGIDAETRDVMGLLHTPGPV